MNIRFHNDESDSDFVEAVLKDGEEALKREHQYRVHGIGFTEVLQQVA